MNEYCIYLRKSRTDIEFEANSKEDTLKRHEETLLKLAKNLNLNVTKIYKEIVSGETIALRPEIQKLLHDVENNKYVGVLVIEIERLARGDTIDQGIIAQTFKYSNTQIITPVKIYNPENEFDEEYFEFGLFMSRREYKTINRRLQNGRLISFNEGKYIGSIPPYGYKRKKLEKEKGYILEINKKEAKIVKLIFELYTNGCAELGIMSKIGINKIAALLNNLNIKPRKINTWSASSIKNILENPVYIGKLHWNLRKSVKHITNGKIKISRPKAKKNEYLLSEGRHKAIISEKTFFSAQSILYSKSSREIIRKEQKNPFCGIIKCFYCGKNMTRRPLKNNTEYFLCTTKECSNIGSSMKLIDNEVSNFLEKYFSNFFIELTPKETHNNLSYLSNIKKQSIASLKKEEKEIMKQLNNLYNLLEQGIYDNQTFKNRLEFLSNKLNEIKNKLISIDKYNHSIKASPSKNTKSFYDIYINTKSISLKNQMLKEVIEKIEYKKDIRKKDCFELIIYPKVLIFDTKNVQTN